MHGQRRTQAGGAHTPIGFNVHLIRNQYSGNVPCAQQTRQQLIMNVLHLLKRRPGSHTARDHTVHTAHEGARSADGAANTCTHLYIKKNPCAPANTRLFRVPVSCSGHMTGRVTPTANGCPRQDGKHSRRPVRLCPESIAQSFRPCIARASGMWTQWWGGTLRPRRTQNTLVRSAHCGGHAAAPRSAVHHAIWQ